MSNASAIALQYWPIITAAVAISGWGVRHWLKSRSINWNARTKLTSISDKVTVMEHDIDDLKEGIRVNGSRIDMVTAQVDAFMRTAHRIEASVDLLTVNVGDIKTDVAYLKGRSSKEPEL